MGLEKKLKKALTSGKDIERYLPAFLEECASFNQRYTGISFAMHYYNLYESLLEQLPVSNEEKRQILKELNEVIRENLLKPFDGELREAAVCKLHQMRLQSMKRMQILTAYTDRFLLYEYVLNRLEYKFEEKFQETEDETFAQELLAYIFDTQDNVIINHKIQEMLSQLPIRMAKGKFFDLLHGSLSIYIGAEISTVEDYIYMLRCAAGLYYADGEEECYPELKEILKLFKETDYRELSIENYEELTEKLKTAVNQLKEETGFYYNLQELCNVLYAFLLNYPYASAEASNLWKELLPVVQEVAEGFAMEHPVQIKEETVCLFEKTEGKLEEYADIVLKQQGLLHEIQESSSSQLESMMLSQLFECLLLSEKLLSNSLFIELDQEGKLNQKPADRTYIEQRTKELSEEFASRLNEQSQMLNRAMIAGVLKEMPVFFQDQKEVLDYIRTSLSGCRNQAEKTASIHLMREIMKEGF